VEIAQKSMFLMFYLLLITSGIVYIFRDPIVRFFIPNNPEVIEGAKEFLSIVLIGIPYFGIFRVEISLLTGSGHTFQGMILSVVRLWGLRIPMAFYLSLVFGMGAVGVWFAMAVSNMVSAGIGAIFYLKGDWKEKIIKEPRRKTPVQIS